MDPKLRQNALIEDALSSQSLAPMPRGIAADVMARIQKRARPALFTWSDFVLSFVVVSCIAALWFAALNLPPILLAKLRIQGILLYQDFLLNARWLIPAAMFGLATLLSALTIPSLLRMTMDHRR